MVPRRWHGSCNDLTAPRGRGDGPKDAGDVEAEGERRFETRGEPAPGPGLPVGRVPVASVGEITEPAQAEEILTSGRADAVLLARALLRDPHWPLHAARELGADAPTPNQYLRAF